MLILLIFIFQFSKAFEVPEAQCFNDNHCLVYGPYYRCKAIVYPNGHWIGICHNTRPDQNRTEEMSSRQMARYRECCTNEDCGPDPDIGCNVDLGCPVDPIEPIHPVAWAYWRPWTRNSK